MQSINIASNSQQHSMLHGIVKQKKLEANSRRRQQQSSSKTKSKTQIAPGGVYKYPKAMLSNPGKNSIITLRLPLKSADTSICICDQCLKRLEYIYKSS
jgi:hypothetical protein